MRSLAVAMAALGGLVLYASLAGARSPGPDPSAHLLLVPDSDAAEAALSSSDVRVVAAYEEFTLVEARGGDEADLRAAGASRRDDLREISLPGSPGIDPLAERESLAAKGVAEPGEALVLVQFVGPIKDAWLERLRSTGARIVEYVAQNGYVVHATGAEVDRLADLVGTYPAVRAVTRVGSEDKVSEGAADTGLVAVQTLAGRGGGGRAARSCFGRRGGAALVNGGGPQHAVPAAQPRRDRCASGGPGRGQRHPVLAAAAAGRARFADRGREPQRFRTRPRQLPCVARQRPGTFGGGNFNFAIDFTDEGLDNGNAPAPGHDDFTVDGAGATSRDRLRARLHGRHHSAEDCGGHGTNVASIAAGYNAQGTTAYNDSSGYNYGLGVAPRAQIGASKVFDCNETLFLNPAMVTADAFASNARISNNSWGNSDEGTYSPDSQDYDALVRDAHRAASAAISRWSRCSPPATTAIGSPAAPTRATRPSALPARPRT